MQSNECEPNPGANLLAVVDAARWTRDCPMQDAQAASDALRAALAKLDGGGK